MKILDITHFYATESGGIKTYIDKKSDFIKEQHTDITHTVVVPSCKNETVRDKNIKRIFIKSPLVPFWKPYRLITSKSKVASILKHENPDIVEVGSPFFLPSWICKNREKLKFTTIGFFHSNVEESVKSLLKNHGKQVLPVVKRYIKKEYGKFDLVIAPSYYVEKYLNSIGIEKTLTIHLGTDTHLFSPDKKEKKFKEKFGIPKNRTLLLYAGRLSKDKNILELYEIFSKLQKIFPDKYHFVIAGSGPDEEKLKELFGKNATFLGYIKEKEKLATIYSSCDIFVTPSKSETFGLAIIEAQASGTPVVAYKASSIPEVNLIGNLLATDENDFIKSIFYAEKLLSPKFRKDLSLKVKNSFSWERTFNILLNRYKTLIKEKTTHSV